MPRAAEIPVKVTRAEERTHLRSVVPSLLRKRLAAQNTSNDAVRLKKKDAVQSSLNSVG